MAMRLDSSFLLVFAFIQGTYVNAFFRNCEVNQTLIIPEGSTAIFNADGIETVRSTDFRKYNASGIYHVFHSLVKRRRMFPYILFEPWMAHRTDVKFERMSLTIIIRDIEMTDNGTYMLNVDTASYCYALLVLRIHLTPNESIEEHSSAYIHGYPKASELRRLLVNATMMWQLDGKNISQAPEFVLQDGEIWIGSVSRTLNRKNITYLALYDNGSTSEVNYTLNVTYGPTAVLFTPNKVQYVLNNGETMPDISCSVHCNPACIISWDRNSRSSILSLGKVIAATEGEYVCTATRVDQYRKVNRSITVHVTDNTALTNVIAALAGTQAVTTIILGICCILICRKNNISLCPSCLKCSKPQKGSAKTTTSGQENMSEIEIECYEELNYETRITTQSNSYEHVEP